MPPYHLLSDLVLIIHLGFILFVLLGGFLALRWRWLMWLHIPSVMWAVWVEVMAWICPLTHLENALRQRAQQPSYDTSFVEQYLLPIIYPAQLTPQIQFILALVVIVINLIAYGLMIKKRSFRQRKSRMSE